MEEQEKKVIIICGPSGAGKTTIVNYLMDKYPLGFSISATTRPPRKGEMDGREYFFMTLEDFEKKMLNMEFAETEQVYDGIFYGTLNSEIERIWMSDKIPVFDVDIKGAISLRKKFQHLGIEVLDLFIAPPDTEYLYLRLKRRGDDEESIKERIKKADEEMKAEPFFKRVIHNKELCLAQDKAQEIVSDFIETRAV